MVFSWLATVTGLFLFSNPSHSSPPQATLILPSSTPTPAPTPLGTTPPTYPTPSPSPPPPQTPTATSTTSPTIPLPSTPSPSTAPSASPEITPSPTALAPTFTSSPSLTPSSSEISNANINVTILTSPIERGKTANLQISVPATSSCALKYTTPSGTVSSAQDLQAPKIADSNGVISWSWKISPNTKVGSGKLDINCSQNSSTSSQSLQITILE